MATPTRDDVSTSFLSPAQARQSVFKKTVGRWKNESGRLGQQKLVPGNVNGTATAASLLKDFKKFKNYCVIHIIQASKLHNRRFSAHLTLGIVWPAASQNLLVRAQRELHANRGRGIKGDHFFEGINQNTEALNRNAEKIC